jgi:methyl-accepting chemotaxis protein
VIANDEIGDLTASFNFVRAYFERLAVMAEAVAAGDLTVDPAGKGDLPNAFRGMVDRLHAIVVQLRVTSLSLGAAISDIHAATREQETATTRQLDEIKSLDEHMRSLAGSAMLVEQASGAVLGIAERSASNTSALAGKIRTLSEHNHAVEQLLEQVREIAGRSDLLALNGSLEATRAGEAGRGFALVAGEMRRLAERITGIVDSMRSLVADIHDSSVSAVLATEQAGALAAETTQSARSITNETSRQSVETGQASDATAKLANILAESSVSIVQTRAIAEALDQQADQLERTLTAFTLREFS